MAEDNSAKPESPRASSHAARQKKPSKAKGRPTSPEESAGQQYELSKHQSQRKKRKSSGGAQVSQLNLASMVDVIFLLLIYFVITANFVQDEGVLVAKLPSGSGEQSPSPDLPKETIDIYLTSVNQTEVLVKVHNQSFRGFTALAQYLAGIQDNPSQGRSGSFAPDNPIIIHPDGKVRWQHVVQAFNATVKTGWTSVSFAQAGGG